MKQWKPLPSRIAERMAQPQTQPFELEQERWLWACDITGTPCVRVFLSPDTGENLYVVRDPDGRWIYMRMPPTTPQPHVDPVSTMENLGRQLIPAASGFFQRLYHPGVLVGIGVVVWLWFGRKQEEQDHE